MYIRFPLSLNAGRYLNKMKNNIHLNLRTLMASRKLSVADLADKIKVDRQSVYSWLKGQNMTIDRLFDLATALSCDVGALVSGERSVDMAVLKEAIITIESSIGNKTLSPAQKARLISYLYEELLVGGDVDSAKITRLLLLVE